MIKWDEVAWCCDTTAYEKWTPEERHRVEQFLIDHGIEPARVPVARHNELIVRVTSDGLMLSTWLQVRSETGVKVCPTCPSCALHEHVEVPLKTAVPDVALGVTRFKEFTLGPADSESNP